MREVRERRSFVFPRASKHPAQRLVLDSDELEPRLFALSLRGCAVPIPYLCQLSAAGFRRAGASGLIRVRVVKGVG